MKMRIVGLINVMVQTPLVTPCPHTVADGIGVQSVVDAINLAAGKGSAGTRKLASVRELKGTLVKQLTSVEKFAYEQQKAEFLPAGFQGAGYCAPGVVPREDSACKVSTQIQTGRLPSQASPLKPIPWFGARLPRLIQPSASSRSQGAAGWRA